MKTTCSLVLATVLLSQGSPATIGAQNPEEVINRYVAAIGGPDVLADINTMRYVRVVQNTEDSKTTIQSRTVFFTMRPYFYRTERSETNSFFVSDGTKAWRGTKADDEGRVQWEEASRVLSLRDLDFERPFGPFLNFEVKGHHAIHLGRTEMDGISLETVRVAWSDGGEWDYYFDPSTDLCYGYDASPGAPGGLIRVDDYQQVENILLPLRNIVTDTLPDGQVRIHERLYSEFDFNLPFPEGLFRPGQSRPFSGILLPSRDAAHQLRQITSLYPEVLGLSAVS